MKKISLIVFLLPLFIKAQVYQAKKDAMAPAPVTQAPAKDLGQRQQLAMPKRSNEGPVWGFYVTENPSFNVTTSNVVAPMEVGYAFKVSRKGLLYAFSVYMPVNNAAVTVSLWDGTTHQLIKQKKIVTGNKDNFSKVEFENEAVTLDSGKTYVLSMNTAAVVAPNYYQYYLMQKGSNAQNFLPYTYQHITVTEMRYTLAQAKVPTYPADNNYYVNGKQVLPGLVDFAYYATQY
ncbi:DUF4082 domain-containing protein [Ferruginibacter sp.]